MRVGLVRHFRVNIKRKRFMTSEDYNKHGYDYDRADVIPNEIVIDEEWDKCYCSSLPRAITTAETIYHGELIITDDLVEIPSSAFFNIRIPLHYHVWSLLSRIAWIRDHISQPEGRTKTLKRVNEIMDIILKEKDQNILIVSHAGTLYEIQKILRRKGFKGERFLKARNGKLYSFRK